jgi:hypothetical protein
MNYALLFFRNPKRFYKKILDSKAERFVIIALILYSFLFLVSHFKIEQLGEGQSALFYVDSKILSILFSLLLEFLAYAFWASLIFFLFKILKVPCKIRAIFFSIFSIKIISGVALLLNVIFYYTSSDLKFAETLGWIEFLFELIYLFIAIRVISGTSTVKAILVQIASLLVIALISFYFFPLGSQPDKSFQFKTTNEVGFGNEKKAIIEGIIKWEVQNHVYFAKNIGSVEISEERIDDYYYAYMYENIVIEYANKEIPKVIDRIIIDKIITECNKKLDDDKSGIKILDLQLKKM